MDEFRFAFVPAFVLFLPAVVLIIRWWIRENNDLPPVLQYSDTRLLAGLPASVRVQLRRLPDFLLLIAWSLLVIGLARPQAGDGEETIRGEGLSIVLALDISDSMATSDFNGLTRFDAAKDVIQDFIDGRSFDRIGLVVFAEDAFYQAPPTTDYALLSEIVADSQLAADINLSNRTAIGQGIASATNMLRDSTSPSKVIILITDGANNAGDVDPISAALAADAFEVRVYTIGIGGTDLGDALDEPTLRQIANITDGRYFNALSLPDLQNVYEQIDRLEQAPVERRLTIRWREQAWVFLWAALGVLCVERFLRHTVFQTIP
ncbi:MAG: VWA domain-containing protein [Chloroflexota bacterium]